jgi:hypothetical protein
MQLGVTLEKYDYAGRGLLSRFAHKNTKKVKLGKHLIYGR